LDVQILGEEYREKDFTGKDIGRKRGIEFYFNERSHRFSSSELRQRVAYNTGIGLTYKSK
jgi:glycerol-3-phosphate cytidylyltransferase